MKLKSNKIIQENISDILETNKKISKRNVYTCNECDFSDTEKRRLSKHRQMHKLHKCSECEFTESNLRKFNKHKQEKHRKYVEYRCDVCNYVTKHKTRYLDHKLCHNGQKTFICNVCHKGFIRKHSLVIHLKIHGIKADIITLKEDNENHYVFSCSQCDYFCDSMPKLQEHELNHNMLEMSDYLITELKEESDVNKVNKQNELYDYIENELNLCARLEKPDHEKETDVEELGNDVKPNKNELDKHNNNDGIKIEKTHESTAMHYDEERMNSNQSEEQEDEEIRNISKSKEFSANKDIIENALVYNCNVCQFITENKEQYEKHLFIHKTSFVSNENIKEENLHKPFLCSECDYSCDNKHQLFTHNLKHGYNQLFVCTECSFVSPLKQIVKEHIVIHIDTNPYACVGVFKNK
ncbi:unnamed protein product [Meganyctiphanes norvegica]|uniref:C2H2-type domain-containing protein n=1 Tax=Meganyctiphanes norvegica TaxID=48144 RepID=A0AAV2RDU7_MEGNR